MPIALWAVRLDRPPTPQESAAMLRLLPPARRERLLRIRQEERRHAPLCAYLLLRQALWELYHWREFPAIGLGDLGKPFFPAHPDVHFSISHTGGAALVGLSDQPVGVDIEKIRPVSGGVMRRLADTDDALVFFRVWVRREARVKRSGRGIGDMLGGEPPMQPGEAYFEVDTFLDYVAGAAAQGPAPPGAVRAYTLRQLLRAAAEADGD